MTTRHHPVLRHDGTALWRQIANRLQQDIASGNSKPGERLPTEAELSAFISASIATPCAGRWRNCRATGWCGSSRVVAASSPKTCWTTRWRRGPGFPSGSGSITRNRRANAAIARDPADQRVAAGWPFAPAVVWCCWSAWDSRMTVPVSLTRHYFPATRLKGMLEALRASPRITDALRAVGVGDYLRQQTRVTARLPTQTEADCCAWRATGRCWSPRTSTSIAPERSWNFPTAAIRRRGCRSFSNHEGRRT